MTHTSRFSLLPVLMLSCVVALCAYILLMVAALYFASSVTELSAAVRVQEADVVRLETEYYAAIRRITETDPNTLGFVLPTRVVYVDAAGSPALSRAGD